MKALDDLIDALGRYGYNQPHWGAQFLLMKLNVFLFNQFQSKTGPANLS